MYYIKKIIIFVSVSLLLYRQAICFSSAIILRFIIICKYNGLFI